MYTVPFNFSCIHFTHLSRALLHAIPTATAVTCGEDTYFLYILVTVFNCIFTLNLNTCDYIVFSKLCYMGCVPKYMLTLLAELCLV